jgi:hypothetical protein
VVTKVKKVKLDLTDVKVGRKPRAKKATGKARKRKTAKQIRQEAAELSALRDLGIGI